MFLLPLGIKFHSFTAWYVKNDWGLVLVKHGICKWLMFLVASTCGNWLRCPNVNWLFFSCRESCQKQNRQCLLKNYTVRPEKIDNMIKTG